jgi:protein-tyrosine phosphatase
MVKVLFVCMGNICRSPTAEGVLRAQVERAGLAGEVQIDSAGTHGYHIGKAPDGRAQQTAAKRGYDLSGLRARRVATTDFSRFDLILAMDRDNLSLLRDACPPTEQHRLALFLDYARNFAEKEVPDPYYGGPEGFERVLDLVEDASLGLIDALRQRK